MTVLGENVETMIGELEIRLGNLGSIFGAQVSKPYRTGRFWRVAVTVESLSGVHIAWQPRFGPFDDASSFRLAAIDLLSEAM